MNKKQLGSILIISILAGCADEPTKKETPVTSCTHAVGDVVELLSPAVVAEQIYKSVLVKGEYETTEEFNARKKVALEKNPSRKMIVEATYSPKYINYDADNEGFLVEYGTWSNVTRQFNTTIPFTITNYDLPPLGILHALGLHQKEKVIKTYTASNAYGKEVEVVKFARNVYRIFDRTSKNDEKTWEFDFAKKGSYSDENLISVGIFLPVERAQAKSFKSNLRFGIEFTSREPFIFQGMHHQKPEINNPIEVEMEINTIHGDLECLIVTDAKGTVLKVVETAY